MFPSTRQTVSSSASSRTTPRKRTSSTAADDHVLGHRSLLESSWLRLGILEKHHPAKFITTATPAVWSRRHFAVHRKGPRKSKKRNNNKKYRPVDFSELGSSDIVKEIMQSASRVLYVDWKEGSTDACVPGSQETRVETDAASGAVVSIALLHRARHDPYGNLHVRRPYVIDLVYTVENARGRGHCTSLLRRLKDTEGLEMTAFVNNEAAERAFRKAGFFQIETPFAEEFAAETGLPLEDVPTVWRSK